MIIIDNALKAREKQHKPIRVAMLGAGFMGQGLTNQIVNSVPGMRMVAVYSRQVKKGLHVYHYSGLENVIIASQQRELEDAIRSGKPVVTEDALLLARSEQVDVVVGYDGFSRIRRPDRVGGVQAWQGCRDAQRRD